MVMNNFSAPSTSRLLLLPMLLSLFSLQLLLLLLHLHPALGLNEWSFSQKLVIGNNTREVEQTVLVERYNVLEPTVQRFTATGPLTYGRTPAYLQGRGFVTLITGARLPPQLINTIINDY